ncbi:T9SS type A sorting domain-containing protein [Fibrella forsythiae]|uniref:T9SS type A sorting domain-containing protein n=1 Tax=Fibrella forsythiae TaxID=2817061 RepID=A0ABS3JGZ7_9BACT|nr:T9SS type A sorting domain-containing protein [Fibrella forsythiae]MBO0949283.1 T9SS type A sorting domain-containing protein [Fibrella forsythiae]
MRKTVNTLRQFVLGTCLTTGLTVAAMAQTPAPISGQMRLKVTARNGSELREIERTYRTEGMTDAKRDALVNKLIDSLRATRNGKDSQISVTIEDERGTDRIRFNNRSGQDVVGDVFITPDAPARVYTLPRAPRAATVPRTPRTPGTPMPPNARAGSNDFEIEGSFTFDDDSLGGRRARVFRFDRRRLDSLTQNMKEFGYSMQREFAPLADRLSRMQGLRGLDERLSMPFETWSRSSGGTQASTIRGLEAYPSNPDKFMLNVRFTAPGKGDAVIVVTNPKGKEVARRELKDFTGEFVGQVDLGRKAEGVFFVTVTQNEDGAVRRVVLKKDEASTK